MTGSPKAGAVLPLHLSRVPPGLQAFLAVGLSSTSWHGVPLPLDLAAAGLPGCELLVAPLAVLSTTTVQVSPGKGAATVPVPVPADPSLVGERAYAQWLVPNLPGSATVGATTRGLQLTVQGP